MSRCKGIYSGGQVSAGFLRWRAIVPQAFSLVEFWNFPSGQKQSLVCDVFAQPAAQKGRGLNSAFALKESPKFRWGKSLDRKWDASWHHLRHFQFTGSPIAVVRRVPLGQRGTSLRYLAEVPRRGTSLTERQDLGATGGTRPFRPDEANEAVAGRRGRLLSARFAFSAALSFSLRCFRRPGIPQDSESAPENAASALVCVVSAAPGSPNIPSVLPETPQVL